jgi:pimeloyl-ACP methyl ester carboxylesterase
VPSRNSTHAVDPGRLIAIASRHLRLYEEGPESSVVVIISGAGDCADSWVPIRHQLAASRRVPSYDRAGLGGSEAGAPVNIERYLAELEAVVDDCSTGNPVTLVGHSLGGLIARLYQHAKPPSKSTVWCFSD